MLVTDFLTGKECKQALTLPREQRGMRGYGSELVVWCFVDREVNSGCCGGEGYRFLREAEHGDPGEVGKRRRDAAVWFVVGVPVCAQSSHHKRTSRCATSLSVTAISRRPSDEEMQQASRPASRRIIPTSVSSCRVLAVPCSENVSSRRSLRMLVLSTIARAGLA